MCNGYLYRFSEETEEERAIRKEKERREKENRNKNENRREETDFHTALISLILYRFIAR